jgi:hypothetical protein
MLVARKASLSESTNVKIEAIPVIDDSSKKS